MGVILSIWATAWACQVDHDAWNKMLDKDKMEKHRCKEQCAPNKVDAILSSGECLCEIKK